MQVNLAPENTYDYLIIGAGPAGLQLAYYLECNSRSYAVIERGDSAGTFFQKYPRHDRLLSINKVHTGHDDPGLNMRWDWNSLLTDDYSVLFKEHTDEYLPDKTHLTEYLERFAVAGNLNIRYNTEVAKVSKDGRFYLETTSGETLACKALIVATGVPEPYVPNIPGIELAENYTDVSVDPKDFINKRVLIIGKGNSGFETADALIPAAALIHVISPHPIEMAWKSNFVGHLRAINNVFLETYRLKGQNAALDSDVQKISKRGDKFVVEVGYSHADDEVEELYYDRVIVCTGFKGDVSIFDSSCSPEMTIKDRFPLLTSEWESVNVPDLYFAGTLMQSRDFKKKQSAFIHGFRYCVRMLAAVLENKYQEVPVPSVRLDSSVDALVDRIIDRVNRVSAHWHQPGYFSDVIAPRQHDEAIDYYEDLTVDYVADVLSKQIGEYFTVTLEFGQEIIDAAPNIFAIERPHKNDTSKAHLSTGIHPILRFYSGGEHVSTHHVIEDFANEWKEEPHVGPLRAYLQGVLGGGKAKAAEQSDALQFTGG